MQSNQWMNTLRDDLLISEINIPGTHDCAAINELSGTWHRQRYSITQQLLKGIRLLDVRIAIIKTDVGKIQLFNDTLYHDGDIAKGVFIEYPPNTFLPQQGPSQGETIGDLKFNLQQQTGIPVDQQVLKDSGGHLIENQVLLSDLWEPRQDHPNLIISLEDSDHEIHSTRLPFCTEATTSYEFLTTHGEGHFYQSFASLMNECRDFLFHFPSEFLVVNFQIDHGDKSDLQAIHALRGIINHQRYPLYTLSPEDQDSPQRLPRVGDVRGHMFLFNRINEDFSLGVPLPEWVKRQNCEWIVGNDDVACGFKVFIQDKFKGCGEGKEEVEAVKVALVKQSIRMYDDAIRGDGNSLDDLARQQHLLMTYASISSDSEVFNTKKALIKYLINRRESFRKSSDAGGAYRIGWILFDYPFDTHTCEYDKAGGGAIDGDGESSMTIVDIVIDSNF